jgi:hypothetical protein
MEEVSVSVSVSVVPVGLNRARARYRSRHPPRTPPRRRPSSSVGDGGVASMEDGNDLGGSCQMRCHPESPGSGGASPYLSPTGRPGTDTDTDTAKPPPRPRRRPARSLASRRS